MTDTASIDQSAQPLRLRNFYLGRQPVLDRNQALFGYDAHELESKSFADLFAPESIGVAIDYLERLQGKGVAALLKDLKAHGKL